MTPFAVVSSATGTSQASAAASNNIRRAVAPARRSPSQPWRIDWLPPASCRLKRSVLSGACSTSTFFQSMSSSSATSIGMEVFTFCPISGLGDRMVTNPFSPILRKALMSNQFLGNSSPCVTLSGVQEANQLKPSSSPPEDRALAFRKERRLCWVETVGMGEGIWGGRSPGTRTID